ncbi:MAG: sigma-70 family RNA polymerase sigma factor [Verrucomicrobiae bacterium]|nr:sigma-70 family RNA polymerase sigma factor [Verrucomicrobiae bacterium]
MPEPTANAQSVFSLTGAPLVETSATPGAMDNRMQQLTRRIAAGEEAAFREFHEAYFDRLYQFLLVVTRGQESEAQEALQQTLLRVVRYARKFDSEAAFWSWLKVVARSTARDAGRKQRRYLTLLQRFALHEATQAESPTLAQADAVGDALEECLAELEAPDRQLIEGKYLDGSTVRELSEQTGLTEKAVESRLLRLRRTLREQVLKKLHTP